MPRVTGSQRHDSPQTWAWVKAWTDASLSCLIADRAYDVNAFRAGLAQRGIETVVPVKSRRMNPQFHDPERYRAPRRRTGRRLARAQAERGRLLGPIRPAFPGFSALGGRLALAEFKPLPATM